MKVSPDMSEKHFSSFKKPFVTNANEQNTVSTVTDEEKWKSSDGYPANETLQNTHTHTHFLSRCSPLHQALHTHCQRADGCVSRLSRWAATVNILELLWSETSLRQVWLQPAPASAPSPSRADAEPTAATHKPYGEHGPSVEDGTHTHTHTQEMLPDDMMQQQADTHPNTDRLDSCPVGGGVLMVVGVCVCV